MTETVMPDYLQLQLSCLAGGAILQVHSLEEARAAEAWGAVAIYFSDLGVLSDDDLSRLVEEVSLHPLCMPADFARLDALYKQRTAHHFARVPIPAWGDLSRAVADVESLNDVKKVFDPATNKPHLILCKDEALLPFTLEERGKAGAQALVFVETDSIEGGSSSLRSGAHGVLLNRKPGAAMPTTEDQRLLMRAVIETAVGPWPQDKRVIGVMSHQGDYPAHLDAFEKAIQKQGKEDAVAVKEIRTRSHCDSCDAVVLPGGWSNLQSLYLAETGIDRELRSANEMGRPVLGTCAGMILCGSTGGRFTQGRVMLGLIPGTVDNNVVDGVNTVKKDGGLEGEEILFSNGPVLRDFDDGVRVLAHTNDSNRVDGAKVVGAQYGSTFVFSYHDYESTHPDFLKYCLSRWPDDLSIVP